MWGDEAQLLIEARKFIQGVYATPFIVDHLSLPALYEYVLSFPLRLAGSVDVTLARGISGVLGALSAPLLYLIARELGYARRAGIVAGVALATTFWDVSFSRLVLPNIMAVSATSVTVLFLVMAIRRASLRLAALAGIALAWDGYAHLTGMMAIPIVAGWLAFLILGYSRWWTGSRGEPAGPQAAELGADVVAQAGVPRQFTRPAGGRRALLDLNSPSTEPRLRDVFAVTGAVGVVALVCAWPLLQLYLAPGSALQGHVAGRFLLSPENRAVFAASHPDIGSGIVGILWYQFKVAAAMFTVRGQPGGVFNLDGRPLLDPVSGVLFIVGVASALWMWRRPAAALGLLWLAVPVVLGTMLTIDQVWSFHRSIIAAPAMCLLVALGLETVLLALRSILSQTRWRPGSPAGPAAWWPSLRLGIVALATVTIGMLGIQRYWDFANAPATRQAFYNSAHEWSLFIGPRGAIPVTVVGPYGWAVEFPTLYAPAASICQGRWDSTWNRCPLARIVIFDNDPLDAQHYAAGAGVPIHPGQSEDGIVRYWYAEGQPLPDPAHVIGGVR
jgi:hypothetical protein